jgi:hypothetical protein
MVENAYKRAFERILTVRKLRYALAENLKIIYISTKQKFKLY